MKKFIMLAAALFSAIGLLAAENLVQNGTFEQLAAGKPVSWIVKKPAGISFSGDGAPESGYVRFDLKPQKGQKGYASIFQSMEKVVKSNQKYTLSFKLRTKGFKGNLRVILINDKWQKGAGLSVGGRFPADWKEYKKVITMPPFKKDARLIVMTTVISGTVDFADIKVEEVK